MAKKKRYDTSRDEERKQLIGEALRNLNAATLVNLVESLWRGFIQLWGASEELRGSMGMLFIPQDEVLEFLSRMDRIIAVNVPAQLVATLEGRCGKQ